MAPSTSYVLITPARNEAEFIELTIRAVVAQTILPQRWIIVSDGSTDGTDDIVRRYATELSWIELVRMPERRERHFAGKVQAFNAGYVKACNLDYKVIGNLDADITFGGDYFEFLLEQFADNPRLGVAGTPFKEDSQRSDYRFVSAEHVSGACQLFRRECFEEIGGYRAIRTGGVDLAAVITARMKGWQTHSFSEKTSVHHRKQGEATRGVLRGAFEGGRADYLLGCDPIWQVLRSGYRFTTAKPLFIGGTLCLAGYVSAALSRAERVLPADVVRFRRAEERRRLMDLLRRSLSAQPLTPRRAEDRR
jgi:glycosyltransferase involved in cell wall biosynthesis